MKSKVVFNENNHKKTYVETDWDKFTQFYTNVINSYEIKIKKLLICILVLGTVLGITVTILITQMLSGIISCAH